MFYLFEFKEEFKKEKNVKEKLCAELNNNQNYFKNITCRVGSKSIKKEDVLNFKLNEEIDVNATTP